MALTAMSNWFVLAYSGLVALSFVVLVWMGRDVQRQRRAPTTLPQTAKHRSFKDQYAGRRDAER